MKKVYVTLLIAVILWAGLWMLPTAAADQQLQIIPQVNVYSISRESYVRKADLSGLEQLAADEYYAFCFEVTNKSNASVYGRSFYARIDGGEQLGWAGGWIDGNATSLFHIYYSNMSKVTPGLHRVDFYINDELKATAMLSKPRNWSQVMSIGQVLGRGVGSAEGLAPYMVFYPQFNGSDGRFTEYAVDFEIDLAPRCSYLSLLNWSFDSTGLNKKYRSITSDYGGLGGYCGLQVWGDGTHAIIMTVWDAFTVDRQGRREVHKPTLTAPADRKAETNRDMAEGSFSHVLYPYNWEEGHPYRILIQQSTSADTGNMKVSMWICDLITNAWTMLAEYDTGLPYTCMKDACGFLEDYGGSEAPRSAELANMRIRSYKTGRWVGAKSAVVTINNSMAADTSNYQGTYNFGAQGNTLWMISSGRRGLSSQPKSGTRVNLAWVDPADPY